MFHSFRFGSRDRQLLRRELGSELSSFTESLRRHHFHRGGRSPHPSGSGGAGGSVSGFDGGDEAFIKVISGIVQNVFK